MVLPLGFVYLYYSNCEMLVMLGEEDERPKPLPDAKHPSTFLIIVFWIMVGNVVSIFLLLNLMLLSMCIIAVWLYFDWQERTAEERNIKGVLSTLRRGVSRVFGDKECVICTEEFKANDQVVQLKCHRSHVFHSDCMELAVSTGHRECPLCRKTIF